MNRPIVDRIASALLYEGYILYPYRPSLKNRQRWTFGGLYPEAYCRAQNGAESACNQTEVLVRGGPDATLQVTVRFLHLTARGVGELSPPLKSWPRPGAQGEAASEPPFRPVESLRIGVKVYYTWQEAEEREIAVGPATLAETLLSPRCKTFTFPRKRWLEPLSEESGRIVGVLVRDQQELDGSIELTAVRMADEVSKVSVRVLNRASLQETASRDEALLRSLVSVHTILQVQQGAFISLLDPPAPYGDFAAECRNVGTWPVLVGEEDTMLSSPIILYDYPQVAVESPGDFFDGTEIDEMLTLRIMTLTDDEKRAMAAVDGRAQALLARTEALSPEMLMNLHGSGRTLASGEIRPGDRVRLHPRGRADILDLALAEKTATVQSIEEDQEGRIYLAVTVDDDPGKDLGKLRQPGHRFFFAPEEVEVLS